MQNTPPPETFADLLLAANPAAWPGRRKEAHAILTQWLQLAEGCERMPHWLTSELPKTFPLEL